jgi:hypothetical protein
MVASTAGTRNDRSWPNNGSVPKTGLGGHRVSPVRIVAMPHTLVTAMSMDGRNCKAHDGDLERL